MNRNLSNCEKARKKKDFGASTGFEPVASALALQCSTSLSYEDTYTGGRPMFVNGYLPYIINGADSITLYHLMVNHNMVPFESLFISKQDSFVIVT